MKLIDIQHNIDKILGDNFSDFDIIPGSNDGFEDIKAPTFIVSVRGIGTSNYADYKHKVVNVTLYYVDKEYDHMECLNIQDKLENVFGLSLKVNDRFFSIENLDFIEQDFLQCDFTLKFNDDSNINKKKYDKMDDLDMNL